MIFHKFVFSNSKDENLLSLEFSIYASLMLIFDFFLTTYDRLRFFYDSLIFNFSSVYVFPIFLLVLSFISIVKILKSSRQLKSSKLRIASVLYFLFFLFFVLFACSKSFSNFSSIILYAQAKNASKYEIFCSQKDCVKPEKIGYSKEGFFILLKNHQIKKADLSFSGKIAKGYFPCYDMSSERIDLDSSLERVFHSSFYSFLFLFVLYASALYFHYASLFSLINSSDSDTSVSSVYVIFLPFLFLAIFYFFFFQASLSSIKSSFFYFLGFVFLYLTYSFLADSADKLSPLKSNLVLVLLFSFVFLDLSVVSSSYLQDQKDLKSKAQISSSIQNLEKDKQTNKSFEERYLEARICNDRDRMQAALDYRPWLITFFLFYFVYSIHFILWQQKLCRKE